MGLLPNEFCQHKMSLKPNSQINTGLSTHGKTLHDVFNFHNCKVFHKDYSKWKRRTAEAIHINLERDQIANDKIEVTRIGTHYADILNNL